MTGGTVAESCKLGYVEELLTFQSLGAAELQHAMANGAGAQVDELRREEHHHREKEGNDSALLRTWVTMAQSTLLPSPISGVKEEINGQRHNSLQPTLLEGTPSSLPSHSTGLSLLRLSLILTLTSPLHITDPPSSSSQFLILVPALCRSY